MSKLEEVNASYMAELKDASDMMDLYKCRIDHLTKTIDEGEKQNTEESG